jgi:putative transposase
MSRKGNPHDNAKAESFMKTLKHEEVPMAGYRDLADVQQRLFRFVDEVQRAPYSLRARIPAPQRVRTNALPPSGQSLST